MITDKDRSGWFGASDVSMIMGNWGTKTFDNWWLVKLGLRVDSFESDAMNAGTHWEHRILDHLKVPNKDRQILLPELKLRVNLDGDDGHWITEVKTHRADKPYRLPKAHRQQVLVQMMATGMEGRIAAYALEPEDYRNYLRDVDDGRLTLHSVAYDWTFIAQFRERCKFLADCLERGAHP